jgi:hypothetical protein
MQVRSGRLSGEQRGTPELSRAKTALAVPAHKPDSKCRSQLCHVQESVIAKIRLLTPAAAASATK